MKIHLLILYLLTFSVAFGQKTISDILQEVPQGKNGIRQFTKFIKSDSNIAEAYWRRGYEYYRTNQYSLALLDFTKAISKDSTFNHSNVLEDKGLAEEMLGMYNDARNDFTKAISYAYTQDTTIPQGLDKYYYHRGRTKFKLGDTLNAILDLDSSLKFWDFHFYARKLRAMLFAVTGQYQKAMDDYNFLLNKWQGGGMDFSIDAEYAIDYYWRAMTKQKIGDKSYLKDLEIAEKLKYKKFKITDLRGI